MADKCVALIPAAGQGKRMNASTNKQFLELQGMPVIVHTLQAFEACPQVDEIVIIIAPGEEAVFSKLLEKYPLGKIYKLVVGGKERQDSVYNGFCSLEDAEIVLVHDGARPLITADVIGQAVEAAREHGAAVVAVPIKDTIKEVAEGQVRKTLDRQRLWQAQTPQAFRSELLGEAFARAKADGFLGTDDTSLVERLGYPVRIVHGSYYNLKITTPEDLILAEAILSRRNRSESGNGI